MSRPVRVARSRRIRLGLLLLENGPIMPAPSPDSSVGYFTRLCIALVASHKAAMAILHLADHLSDLWGRAAKRASLSAGLPVRLLRGGSPMTRSAIWVTGTGQPFCTAPPRPYSTKPDFRGRPLEARCRQESLDQADAALGNERIDRRPVRVVLPDEPPVLTPVAARTLLRILLNARPSGTANQTGERGDLMTDQVKRLACWGLVSTEDNQDPESSRGWQLTRAKALIEPHGGQIVAEFFDIDKSCSIPPQRRPQARALLQALADPKRPPAGH
jgi:hypothetical protein